MNAASPISTTPADEIPPEPLYKFRTIDNEGYCEGLLARRQLYFARIDQLNDPLDGVVVLPREADPTTTWRWWRHTLGQIYGDLPEPDLLMSYVRSFPESATLSDAEIHRKADAILVDPEAFFSQFDLGPGYARMLERRLATTRVCSLTSNPVSIPMWSYYADGHKGICVGFRVRGDLLFSKAERVHYQTEYPSLSGLTADDDEYYRLSLLTKSRDWEHESEWRIIFHRERSPMGVQLRAESFRTIISGCNTTEQQRNQVADWARAGELGVSFQMARLGHRRFALELEPYA